ncbi:hypothetical protein GCM10028801_03480 [Nocardioides maradonensis]
MNDSPWQVFDAAVVGDGDDVVTELIRSRSMLQTTVLGTIADRVELEACISAVLAGRGAADLSDAFEWCAEASAVGRNAWPRFYLCEALMAGRHFLAALDELDNVDWQYFAAEGLRWRIFYGMTWRAIALLRTGKFELVRPVLKSINDEMTREDDDEILPSPVELLRVLREECGEHASSMVRILFQGIDPQEWLAGDALEYVTKVIRRPPP